MTSLIEALNIDALQELVGAARRVAESTSAGADFVDRIRRCAELQLACDGLKGLMIAEDVSPEVRVLCEEFGCFASVALDAAIRVRRVRPDVSIEHIQQLACGVKYAARLGDQSEYPLLLDIIVYGLLRRDESRH